MTLKEFSQKYDVPYHIVYAASYKVRPVATDVRERDYPEIEMFNAVKSNLEDRIRKDKEALTYHLNARRQLLETQR